MAGDIESVYPSQYETEVLLKGVSSILLRPIKKEDTENWLAFVHGLSRHTLYLRFHHVPKEMGQEDAIRFCTVDYVNTFTFVAEVIKEQHKDIVAIGRYYLGNGSSGCTSAQFVGSCRRREVLIRKCADCLPNKSKMIVWQQAPQRMNSEVMSFNMI